MGEAAGQTAQEAPPILDPACGQGSLYSALAYQRRRIRYPRASQIENKIEYCRVTSKATFEPRCLLIVGESGVGKTSLIQEYLAKHPRREVSGGTIVPVLFSQIPTPATIKEMLTHMLFALGDPSPAQGTTAALTIRLVSMLRQCKVELIILDEFQHFIEQKNARGLREVSEWLKTFLNMAKLPVVLVGMPDCRLVLLGNPQLLRRFSFQARLDPFEWAGDKKKEFIRFLGEISVNLPIKTRPDFTDIEAAKRVYWATEGRAGRVFNLIHRATELALEKELDLVDPPSFSEAYRETLAAFYRDETDPFLGDAPEIDPDGKPVRLNHSAAGEEELQKRFKRPSSKKGSAAKDFAQSMAGKPA